MHDCALENGSKVSETTGPTRVMPGKGYHHAELQRSPLNEKSNLQDFAEAGNTLVISFKETLKLHKALCASSCPYQY